jgi:hypothetical protein
MRTRGINPSSPLAAISGFRQMSTHRTVEKSLRAASHKGNLQQYHYAQARVVLEATYSTDSSSASDDKGPGKTLE